MRVVVKTVGRPKTGGERLLAARVAKGWTVRELGRRAKVAPATISRYERGVGDATFSIVVRLAEAVGVSLDYLAKGKR